MMRCSSVRKLLSPYVDGELSEGRLRRVRDHLSRCGACRSELKALRTLDALSREALAQEPSEPYWASFLPRLHRKMAASPPQSSWEKAHNFIRDLLFPSSPWLKTAGAVASVMLILIVGRALIRSGGDEKILSVPAEDVPKKRTEQSVSITDSLEQKKELDQPALSSERVEEELSQTKTMDKASEEAIASEAIASEAIASKVTISPPVAREKENVLERSLGFSKPLKKVPSVASSEEAEQLYGQTLRFEIVGESEDAAVQFQLNLSKYASTDTPRTLESWQEQRDLWQNFLQTYPESKLAEEACLKLAESWYHIAHITRAPEDLSQALEVNQNCQKTWPEEEVLKRQAQELERALGNQKR
ncbi:MAG: zf-HC2 domain-containing protein [bacterium]